MTCSGVGEENKTFRPQLPTSIEAKEDFAKASPEGLYFLYNVKTQMSNKVPFIQTFLSCQEREMAFCSTV